MYKYARQKCIKMHEKTVQKCTRKVKKVQMELECGPMPKVVVALLNTGGALCSTPQSLADAHY